MRRSMIVLVALVSVAALAWAVLASNRSRAAVSISARRPASASVAGDAPPGPEVAGRFDLAVTCRFACATKQAYEPEDVLAQPGALPGKLTQCPVSGVVFAVDPGRPHVVFAGEDYVTCCDQCARKLERDPGRYLKL